MLRHKSMCIHMDVLIYNTYYALLPYILHLLYIYLILYSPNIYSTTPYLQVMALDEVTGEVTQKFLPEKQVRVYTSRI